MPQARIHAGEEGKSAGAVIELRFRLDDKTMEKLILPRPIVEAFSLMQQGGLVRADLALEIPNRLITLSPTNTSMYSIKIVGADLKKFKLQKIEARGKGNAEDHLVLIFFLYTSFSTDIAQWLTNGLGADLQTTIQAGQPSLPLAEGA